MLSEQGQITDRFTRAVEQLGKEDEGDRSYLSVRLGGIYSLKAAHGAIRQEMNLRLLTSCAHSCEHMLRLRVLFPLCNQLNTRILPWTCKQPSLSSPSAPSPARLENARTDLNGTQLTMRGAQLEGANLYQVDLRNANLMGANLRGANLPKTKLDGVNLYRADISGADLSLASGLSTQQVSMHTGWTHKRGSRNQFARPEENALSTPLVALRPYEPGVGVSPAGC